MELLSIFATLSFIFSTLAYVPYTISTLTSSTRPTLSTWLSWWIMDVAILAGMFVKGAVALQMLAYVIGCAFVIGACLWRGANVGWTKVDTICMVFVLIAIVLWALSGDANFAIVLSLSAVLIGCVPMLKNILKDPAREPLFPWILVMVGGLFGIAAIPQWTIANALTPVVFAIIQVFFVILISRKFLPSRNKTAARVLIQD